MSAAVMSAPGGDLALRCHPGRAGACLTFAYAVENLAAVDLFVMDAIAIPGPEGEAAAADDQAVVIVLAPGGEALLGKFPAPLPPDRRIAVPVVPLARRLAPGASLDRQLAVPLPLAETSPYFADLTLRQYEPVDILAVVFTIGFWREKEAGIAAVPVEELPDFWRVGGRRPLQSAHTARQRFPVKGLQLFKRLDAFPRPARG